jgi:acetyl esterase/lipase
MMPARSNHRCALLLSLALGGLLPAASGAQPYLSYDNLTYAVLGGRPLHLALRVPLGASPADPVPCVVWIHGGGWSGGSSLPVPGLTLRLVVEERIAVASIDYRLTSQAGQYGTESVIFPAQIHDVKGAIRWLRANADQYGLDVDRFGAWGSSAGGHLAALAGTSADIARLEGTVGGNLDQPSGLQVFADYFGPTDILNMNLLVTTPPGSVINHDAPTSPESRLIGWDDPGQGIGDIRAHQNDPNPPYPELVARTRDANPITHVDLLDPPGFMAHGTMDTLVPLGCSRLLDSALTAVQIEHEYRVVEGAGHGSLGTATDDGAIAFIASRFAGQAAVAEPPAVAVPAGELLAWPNPAPLAVGVTFAAGAERAGAPLRIFDPGGHLVANLRVGPDGLARWSGGIPAGVYLAELRTSHGGRRSARITITR